jgi:hypothetical protein
LRDEKPVQVRLESVTKQPFLTGFPRAVVATAKRRLQAAIRGQRAAVLRDSLCGYALMFARFLPASFLARIDPTPRHRHFGQVPVFWAWLAQILESNASCSKAVSLIQAWSRAAGLTVPSGRTGGYCHHRGRSSHFGIESTLSIPTISTASVFSAMRRPGGDGIKPGFP